VQLITRAVSDVILSISDKISAEEIAAAAVAKAEADAAAGLDDLEEGETTEETTDASGARKRRVVHKKIVRVAEEE